jgi:hypothetical protein
MKERILWFLVVALMVPGMPVAGIAADHAGAITTADPDIPLDELKLRLVPLTRDELKVEADAWQKLL